MKVQKQTFDTMQKTSFLQYFKSNYILYILILPSILYFFIFCYLPMYGIIIAFQRFDFAHGYFHSPWVGLYNFKLFLDDPYIFRIVKNTLILNLYGLIFGFPAPVVFALLLNEVYRQRFKKIVQTVSYLPHFISTVILVGLLKYFFTDGGIVVETLKAIGIEAPSFWSNPAYFRPLYIASGIWQGIGWGSIIYLAALNSISVELYEAAFIDGANRWNRIWHITIPGIAPTIIIMLIFNVGSMMNVGFEKVFLMYNEATYSVADVISTYVYRRGLQSMQYSYSTAVNLLTNIINLILICFTNYASRKITETSLW